MDHKRLKFDAIIAVALFLLFGIPNYFNVGWFQRMEAPLYDLGASLRMKRLPPTDPEIVLIEVDQRRFGETGSVPQDKEPAGQLMAFLSPGKAKVIGIDLPLGKTEVHPELTDLRRLQEKIRDHGRGRQRDSIPGWVDDDLSRLESHMDYGADLARRLTQTGNSIIAISVSKGKPGKTIPRRTEVDACLEKNFLESRDRRDSSSHPFQIAGDLDLPATDLCEASLGLGHKLSTLKSGLSDRAHPVVADYQGHLLPSFPLRVAMAYLDLPPREVRVATDHLLLGNRRIPLYDGELLVPSRMPRHGITRLSWPTLSANKSIPAKNEGTIVLISLAPPMAEAFPGMTGLTNPAARAAGVVHTILNGLWIERPGFALYLEMAALFFLLILGVIFSSLKEQSIRIFALLGLALISVSVGAAVLIAGGIWLKTVHMAVALALISLVPGIQALFTIPGLRRELEDTHKLLGLHYRRQGELDQAFEEFRKCRRDPEIKGLLYELGREYEKNAMLTQALRSYEALREIGKYKDTDERIARLGAPGRPLPFEEGETGPERSVLSDSFVRMNKTVGRYQIVSELGKGTMGVVYRAKDPKINRFVAVKVIRFSDDYDQEVLQEVKNRFLREAEIAGKLSHPSIITVFDAGEDQDLTYMAMECLEGRSLSHYCTKENLLPITRAVEVVENIASALDHAHRANVIHRDIKPANIMILHDGGVKVTDFGIAKAVSSSLTKTGIVLGTPNYMSPEQIMGHKIGPRTDIFSLGVLFFNLVTGELPFRGEKLNTLLYQITQAKHPSVRSINPSLPKAVEQIIDKALAKNPDHRFKSAGEMAKYLGLLRSKIDQLAQARSGPATAGSAQNAH